jgi:hypothetical protein
MKTLKSIILIAFLAAISQNMMAQGNVAVTYNMALPLGKTADFIGSYSWQGVGLEGRWQVSDNDIYVGLSGGWNVFYENEYGTFTTNDTRSTTGTQYRYLNSVPVFLSGYKYVSQSDVLTFYGGAGLGMIYNEQRKDFGLWMVKDDGWQFGLAPEVGIIYTVGFTTDLLFSIKYNYGFESENLPNYSTLGINVGILF